MFQNMVQYIGNCPSGMRLSIDNFLCIYLADRELIFLLLLHAFCLYQFIFYFKFFSCFFRLIAANIMHVDSCPVYLYICGDNMCMLMSRIVVFINQIWLFPKADFLHIFFRYIL